jgi:hypothetical protein
MRIFTTVHHATWLTLMLMITTVSPALAQNAAIDPAPDTEASAAQNAAIDPATGRLRGITPEEARVLIESVSRELSQSGDGLTLVYHPNGMVSIDLEDRFQTAALVRVEPDGTLRAQCVSTVEEAERFLKGQLSAPAKPPAPPVKPVTPPAKPAAPPAKPVASPAKPVAPPGKPFALEEK